MPYLMLSERLLARRWSPQQIAAHLAELHPQETTKRAGPARARDFGRAHYSFAPTGEELLHRNPATPAHVLQAFTDKLCAVAQPMRKTLTYDRGREMAQHGPVDG